MSIKAFDEYLSPSKSMKLRMVWGILDLELMSEVEGALLWGLLPPSSQWALILTHGLIKRTER